MCAAKFALPDAVRKIGAELASKNIAVFPVGGCVRDFLMHREPGDFDLAAQCTPERLRASLEEAGYRLSFEGFDFGTVCVHVGGMTVEITCCRREEGYSDRRRPDSVAYTENIYDDLARRDFTVNAMAYDLESDYVIDPFGGKEDIERKIIRCVGSPETRFCEDSLRVLRALRFSSTLGFELDGDTAAAVHAMHSRLSNLSGARILTELTKLISGDGVLRVLMEYSDVICSVIPELRASVGFEQHNPHHIYTVYEHIARTVASCPNRGYLRLTMLLHDMAKPYVCTVDEHGIFHFRGHPEEGARMAEVLLRRLGADRRCIGEVSHLITYHDVRPPATRAGIHKYLCGVGYAAAKELIYIRRADLSAQSPAFHDGFQYIDECERLILRLEAEGAPADVHGLMISGGDVMAAGVPSGAAVGETLERLLGLVAEGKIPNRRRELCDECKRIAQSLGAKEEQSAGCARK